MGRAGADKAVGEASLVWKKERTRITGGGSPAASMKRASPDEPPVHTKCSWNSNAGLLVEFLRKRHMRNNDKELAAQPKVGFGVKTTG